MLCLHSFESDKESFPLTAEESRRARFLLGAPPATKCLTVPLPTRSIRLLVGALVFLSNTNVSVSRQLNQRYHVAALTQLYEIAALFSCEWMADAIRKAFCLKLDVMLRCGRKFSAHTLGSLGLVPELRIGRSIAPPFLKGEIPVASTELYPRLCRRDVAVVRQSLVQAAAPAVSPGEEGRASAVREFIDQVVQQTDNLNVWVREWANVPRYVDDDVWDRVNALLGWARTHCLKMKRSSQENDTALQMVVQYTRMRPSPRCRVVYDLVDACPAIASALSSLYAKALINRFLLLMNPQIGPLAMPLMLAILALVRRYNWLCDDSVSAYQFHCLAWKRVAAHYREPIWNTMREELADTLCIPYQTATYDAFLAAKTLDAFLESHCPCTQIAVVQAGALAHPQAKRCM